VATDVEVARHLLHRKSATQVTPVSILESCLCHLVLPLLVWLL
jgi:hypothetical protein